VINEVRHRVRLRADGGIKNRTRRRESDRARRRRSFARTALMIAEQCIFCHGCFEGQLPPAGITTQN